MPGLCWIRDPISNDGKRVETEQIISIWDLTGADLAVLVAGKSNSQEKDGQKDRRRRCIVADQPDSHEGSGDRSDHSHDRFERNRTHESCTHQYDNGKYRPVIMRQSQDLSAKQGEQTRQTHFDPVADSYIVKQMLPRLLLPPRFNRNGSGSHSHGWARVSRLVFSGGSTSEVIATETV